MLLCRALSRRLCCCHLILFKYFEVQKLLELIKVVKVDIGECLLQGWTSGSDESNLFWLFGALGSPG